MKLKSFDTRFKMLPIKEIIEENSSTRTFVFKYPLGGAPGQFIMMWIPGIAERPMSIAYDNGEEFRLTVCNVGPTSGALHEMKVGDIVGVRGPFGTFYEWKDNDHLALVAGGYGVAPMYFVARVASERGCKVDFFLGARSLDHLLYEDKIEKLDGVNIHISTNDGSKGREGFVTKVLDEVLEKENIDKVFTCGPEVMMKVVGEVADKHKIDCWLSMEKYMKCGIGVCGQCAIDDTGDLACKKGSVMFWGEVRDLPELGNYHRDAQGRKHYYK